jgi:hypothetical protein
MTRLYCKFLTGWVSYTTYIYDWCFYNKYHKIAMLAMRGGSYKVMCLYSMSTVTIQYYNCFFVSGQADFENIYNLEEVVEHIRAKF